MITVKDIQDEMLELLKRFHTVCMEYQIRYSVHGGTMIGIVREHGFIPWDDDADVSFTRQNYTAFLHLIEQNDINQLFRAARGESFYFSLYDNAFPQLWMKRENKPAVWMDFFIYDFISGHPLVQKLKFFRIAVILGLMKNKETMAMTRKRGLYSGLKYGIIWILYLIGKCFSPQQKYRMAEKIRQSSPGKGQRIHRSNDRYEGILFTYPKEVMDEYLLLPFCDTRLMVTKRYDDILVPSFGDYMKPVRDHAQESGVHTLAREKCPF